jgi:oxygen-dependent protoporphyrinogen oxidase
MTRRIIIVGGGIAGLAAAHRLTELNKVKALGLELMVLEASPRLGGCIATERVGDFLIELGPDSFITEKPWALQLCERLDLTPRLISTNPAYQKVYVVHNGRLEALPEGFFLLAPTRLWPFIQTPLFSWRGKLRIGAELLIPRGNSGCDETLASFVRRRFGEEALERVAQPLIGGIYASDPEQLSLAATMPRFQEMEKNGRSVVRAMWLEHRRARKRQTGSGVRWSLFVTLAGGMQELVEAIVSRLPAGNVHLNTRVIGLKRHTEKSVWSVMTDTGQTIEATALILASPAYQSAEILRSVAADLSDQLEGIPYASTATVNLAYGQTDFPRPLDSFGFVVPASEKRKIMACTFSSLKYPQRAPVGQILLRAFVGGSLQPVLLQNDDATIVRDVCEELKSLLGVNSTPLFSRIQRHPDSMPQYHLGHPERTKRIEAALEKFAGLALAGSAYHGVGISDCVRTGEEAAERIINQLSGRLAGSSLSP